MRHTTSALMVAMATISIWLVACAWIGYQDYPAYAISVEKIELMFYKIPMELEIKIRNQSPYPYQLTIVSVLIDGITAKNCSYPHSLPFDGKAVITIYQNFTVKTYVISIEFEEMENVEITYSVNLPYDYAKRLREEK